MSEKIDASLKRRAGCGQKMPPECIRAYVDYWGGILFLRPNAKSLKERIDYYAAYAEKFAENILNKGEES